MSGRVVRLPALAALALLGAASPAAAQRVSKDRACRVDTTAAWYRKQRAWADESRHDWSDEAFRAALLRATAGAGQSGGDALLGFEIAGEQSAAGAADPEAARMLDSLRTLARTRGSTWPTRSVVGPAGVRAVWLLVTRDSSLARTALHRMMEAGPDESPPAAVAILEDRLRLQAGRKQIYATQLIRAADGALAPAPMEDPPNVELRRDAAGLPPLAQALCAARAGQAR
jgi:hypothetical protein